MAGIPGLDRKAMEEERLARMRAKESYNQPTTSKRQRSISPPPTTRPAKMSKVQSTSNRSEGKKPSEPANIVDLTDSPPPKPKRSQPLVAANKSATSPQLLQYPNGVIKKTWADGHPRSNDIKIEEVLEKATLRTALLSAFMWDVPWIMSKINLQQTKCIFVMQAKDQATKQQYQEETEYLRKVLRLCFPSMDGNINCMHSKLMLLFHPHKLRVVVPSANLTNYDWGEMGLMENSVFLIDLPRLNEADKDDPNVFPQFGQELLHLLEVKGCDEDIRKGVRSFDFSGAKDIAFVHSVGGAHYGTDLERTGVSGLSKAVRNLGLSSQNDLHIDFAASSIGSLHDEFLKTIHNAARGEDATALPRATSRTAPKPFQNTDSAANIREIFRVYFPTHDTVAASTGGTNAGGTICLQRKWWEGNNDFPRSCFRDYRSVRSGMLSHNKILYARGLNSAGKKIAWVYHGSANLSESAWGKMSWDRSRKEWKIGCRNWECGVLISVSDEKMKEGEGHVLGGRINELEVARLARLKQKQKKDLPPEEVETDSEDGDAETDSEDESKGKGKKEIPDMSVFKGIVDVPFQYPGAEYGDKEPWYFMG